MSARRRGDQPIPTEEYAAEMAERSPTLQHVALPAFGADADPPKPGGGSDTIPSSPVRLSTGFSDVVLSDDALTRRLLLRYADPSVETEFIIFTHRSPWPFPFAVILGVINTLFLYLGPFPDPHLLYSISAQALLLPAVVLFSDTARRCLPRRLIVSAKLRALFIEHAYMPVLALSTVMLLLGTARHPAPFYYNESFSWDSLVSFPKDVVNMTTTSTTTPPRPSTNSSAVLDDTTSMVSKPPFVLDYLVDMQSIITMPMATTPRLSTSLPWLLLTVISTVAVVFWGESHDLPDNVRILYTAEMAMKVLASAMMIAAWEWDRRQHFEACVRQHRQSTHTLRVVDRLHEHLRAALPAGCASPVPGDPSKAADDDDVRFESACAAIITVRVVSPEMTSTTSERECIRQLKVASCLVDACDEVGRLLGASRFACSGMEVAIAVHLFPSTASAGSNNIRSVGSSTTGSCGDTPTCPAVLACLIATHVTRSFRARYRQVLPDDDGDDPPPLRIGIDVGAAMAIIPRRSCSSLSVVVHGRPLHGADALCGLAMPGSTLVSGEVRSLVSEYFYTTELHRLRVAGRLTSVSILGQQFAITRFDSGTATANPSSMFCSSPSSTPPRVPLGIVGGIEVGVSDKDPEPLRLRWRYGAHEFEDPAVEAEYLAFETNRSVARHVVPVLGVLLCALLAIEYHVTGSPMNGFQWGLLCAACVASIATESLLYRGDMPPWRQTLAREAFILVFSPLFMFSAYVHDDFFSIVRIHTGGTMLAIAFALNGITPNKLPILLDSIICAAIFKIEEKAMVGLVSPFGPTFAFFVMQVIVSTVVVHVYRSRKRVQFADMIRAERVQHTWQQARVRVEERLQRLMPLCIAKRLATPSSAAAADLLVTTTHFSKSTPILVFHLGSDCDENLSRQPTPTPSTSVPPALMDEQAAAVRLLRVLQTTPEVAAGVLTVVRRSSAWILVAFGASCTITNSELRRIAADVQQAFGNDPLNSRAALTITTSRGPAAGALLGQQNARSFVFVGPLFGADDVR
jgi:class 3 adenylate cyclase